MDVVNGLPAERHAAYFVKRGAWDALPMRRRVPIGNSPVPNSSARRSCSPYSFLSQGRTLMSHSRRRLILCLLSVLTLSSATYAWAETDGPVKCYAETCNGGLCVKQEIKCPAVLIPINQP